MHGDAVSKVKFGWVLDMVTAKDVGLASVRVSPLRCHHPPAAQHGCFYLNLGDSGNHTPVEPPGCATPQKENQTNNDDEEASCDNENGLRVHALFPPLGILVVPTERVPKQVYTMRVPTAIKSA
jgi:hypothetical protein